MPGAMKATRLEDIDQRLSSLRAGRHDLVDDERFGLSVPMGVCAYTTYPALPYT
jgi:hypothetical protein